MRTCVLALSVVAAFSLAARAVSAQPVAGAAQAATPDATRSYRRPGELTALCGALAIKDVGLWPDMQAAFERGDVLEIVGLPLGGSINARGQAIVPMADGAAEIVARPETDGLVQYAVKSRPSSGRINARGDVIGALFIDNPDAGALTPLVQRTFVFPAGAGAPTVVDVPAGTHLDVSGLNDNGVGIGNLFRVMPDAALPAEGPLYIEFDKATKAARVRPVVDRAQLPPGLVTTTAASINSKGEVLLNLQRDTGERSRGMFIDKNGQRQITCAGPIGTVEQCAVVRGDAVELVRLPTGIVSMCGAVLLDDGTIVGSSNKNKEMGSPSNVFVWREGKLLELRTFDAGVGAQPSDASGGLVCGLANVPDKAMGKPPKEVDPTLREKFYSLRVCGVLWDIHTGAMLPLDALLPAGSACTHISAAGAIRGNKVLCRGLIDGKEHGLIVTLPANVREGFPPDN